MTSLYVRLPQLSRESTCREAAEVYGHKPDSADDVVIRSHDFLTTCRYIHAPARLKQEAQLSLHYVKFMAAQPARMSTATLLTSFEIILLNTESAHKFQ